jgi:hypothetical protein
MTDASAPPPAFGKWGPPECPFTIAYRHGLMQELRAAVAYGQQAFTRGGMEVGGVLFGNRTAEGLSIRMWRPIGCEHASGPAFVLSERDRAELRKFLASAPALPDLAEVEAVGWFLSHTRSDLSLRESDLALYDEFFPGVTDVALVLRPGRHDAARAGFFFRDAGGVVQSDRSVLEFNIEASEDVWPAMHAETHPGHARDLPFPPERHRAVAPTAVEPEPIPDETSVTAAESAPAAASAAETAPLVVGSRRSWRWIALPIAALVAIAWLHFTRSGPLNPPENPVEMSLTDRDGQLVIAWDHARPELRAARGGHLSIVDGAVRQDVSLTPEQARTGSLTWVRRSAAVHVSLHLDTEGKPLVASAQFLGAAPQAPRTDAADTDALRGENLELRGEVDRAKARAERAEAAFEALQKRLGGAGATKK